MLKKFKLKRQNKFKLKFKLNVKQISKKKYTGADIYVILHTGCMDYSSQMLKRNPYSDVVPECR